MNALQMTGSGALPWSKAHCWRRCRGKHYVTLPPLAAHSAPVTFDFVDLTKHFARVHGLTTAEAELSKQIHKE
jgi:hypothetical protein